MTASAFIGQDNEYRLRALCGQTVYHGLTRAPRDGATVDCAECGDAWVTWCEHRPKNKTRKIAGVERPVRETLTENNWDKLRYTLVVSARERDVRQGDVT